MATRKTISIQTRNERNPNNKKEKKKKEKEREMEKEKEEEQHSTKNMKCPFGGCMSDDESGKG